MNRTNPVVPIRLKAGDKVCLVSPLSTPDRASVTSTVEYLQTLGLEVQIGRHIFDQFGLFAGTDEARLADLNKALRDPDAKAILATRGGRGAYRIADQLEFEAASKSPKVLVGFSEILQLALFKHCGIAGVPEYPLLLRLSAKLPAHRDHRHLLLARTLRNQWQQFVPFLQHP